MSWLRWLRRWRDDEPEPVVSDQDRAHLEDAQRAVANQRKEVTGHSGEAVTLGRYLRYQREEENHLAARIRGALGGGG